MVGGRSGLPPCECRFEGEEIPQSRRSFPSCVRASGMAILVGSSEDFDGEGARLWASGD